MKRTYMVGLASLLLLAVLILGGVAGCSSYGTTTTTTTTTTTSTTPGGAGGGALVINDSIDTVILESISPRGNGVTDLTVTLVATQNVGDKINPVADKVDQKIDVWTDEDVSGFKVGDTVVGHIQYAGDAVIGITLRLSQIVLK